MQFQVKTLINFFKGIFSTPPPRQEVYETTEFRSEFERYLCDLEYGNPRQAVEAIRGIAQFKGEEATYELLMALIGQPNPNIYGEAFKFLKYREDRDIEKIIDEDELLINPYPQVHRFCLDLLIARENDASTSLLERFLGVPRWKRKIRKELNRRNVTTGEATAT